MVELSELKHVHCVGIGGIGLSAIAEILLNMGIHVSGSEMHESEIIDGLMDKGADIFLAHRAKNVGEADLVVYSVAVPMTNPELVFAEENGIPVLTRAQMLGILMEGAKSSVAVSGAHGKTTTTSMISLILKNAKLDPTILVGGNLLEIGGNVRIGSHDYFVTEACEYMDSFLQLRPKYAIILNIDEDHLDYFKDINHIARSFNTFANLVPDDGVVFALDSDPFVSSILEKLDKPFITFGFHRNCDYRATELDFSDASGMPSFDITHNGDDVCKIRLSIPGRHNIANALAAFSCCHHMGIDTDIIVNTLESFHGTKRRFEVKGTTMDGVTVVDDYAHHPTEIAATIKAATTIPHNNMWILFQPHTYTRTMALHDDFAEALALADKIVLAEIYAARENNVHQITSKSIVTKIKEDNSGKEAYFFKDFDDIAGFVLNNAEEGDLVITMGAGDIYKVGEMMLEADRLGLK
ncbi:MAG: UDP-N-acetylmuramate--L-alanine ligase [Clostridiales Family XIII bacterium]|jgi:UDP-N-acetylmuramate--alanine ligase|nr:UDP-N-acetylmuramate--L-alanine ligase [Clostridiales Family XIII bacterium]